MAKETESMDKLKIDNSVQDDDDPKNFKTVSNGAGSLLRIKQNIEHVMKIKDRSFIELETGEGVLVLYDFLNIKTEERTLIFLIEESQYMYMTKDFDKEFEVLRTGTYEHSNIEKDSNITQAIEDLE